MPDFIPHLNAAVSREFPPAEITYVTTATAKHELTPIKRPKVPFYEAAPNTPRDASIDGPGFSVELGGKGSGTGAASKKTDNSTVIVLGVLAIGLYALTRKG